MAILCRGRREQLQRKRGYRCLPRPELRMDKVDLDGFEAVPRELAVKAERSPEVTPKALLTKSLRRLYQPVSGANPERFGQLLIELEQRPVERRKE
jgi:hypothetical protein